MSATACTCAAPCGSTVSALAKTPARSTEDDWVERERQRLEHKRKKDDKDTKAETEPVEPDAGAAGSPIPTPRFVSEAYFMEFKFEPGNYYLAGRERLEGQEVLRIEYYPKRMFSDDDDRERERETRALGEEPAA